jgi:hypothetical protein
VTKLFGFIKPRGDQPARLVRVEASRRMSREELRSKLVAISARKTRVQAMRAACDASKDDQPPSRGRAGRRRRVALTPAA